MRILLNTIYDKNGLYKLKWVGKLNLESYVSAYK